LKIFAGYWVGKMPSKAIMKVTDKLGCLMGTGVALRPDEVMEAALSVAFAATPLIKALDLDKSGF
jgi:hypothetical protein